MKKSEVEHVLRAAARICEDNEFIIIGSQALHAKYPDLADDLLMSQEVDLISKNKAHNTDLLNAIGADSQFHEQFGYYADPVDLTTATLPKNWKNRLVNLKIDTDTEGAKAYCLEPHDLAVAKLYAAREKDSIFVRALLQRKLLDEKKVMLRITETPVPDEAIQRMTKLFSRLVNEAASLPSISIEKTVFIHCDRANLSLLESFGVSPSDYDDKRGGVSAQLSEESKKSLRQFAADFRVVETKAQKSTPSQRAVDTTIKNKAKSRNGSFEP